MINQVMITGILLFVTPLHSMHLSIDPAIQSQIDFEEGRFNHSLKWCRYLNETLCVQSELQECDIYWRHYQNLADIVCNAGDRLSDQAKLTYLVGNLYREERKKIIKKMIDVDVVNPNDIGDGGDALLEESIANDDLDFARYLLKKDATAGPKARAIASKKSLMHIFLQSNT